MKRRLIYIGIGIWAIIAVIAIGIVFIYVSGDKPLSFSTSKLLKEENSQLTDINRIEIQSGALAIEIVESSDEKVTVLQYGNKSLEESKPFHMEKIGDTLKVTHKNKNHIFSFRFGTNEKLTIKIPRSYTGNMECKNNSGGIQIMDSFQWNAAEIKVSSGGVKIDEDFTAENLNIKAASGGIHLRGTMKVEKKLDIHTNSGGIRAEDIVANDLRMNTTSGGIGLGKTTTKSFVISTNSGGAKAMELSGSGSISSTSGGITINLLKLTDDVNIKANSGGVKVFLDKEESFTFEGRCTSGGIKTNYPFEMMKKNSAKGEIGNNPNAKISISTSSGGITINQK